MKTLVKRLSALCLAAAMVLLCGCHGSVQRSAFTLPDAFDTETPIEITFWAKNDTNKSQTNIYKQAIEDFQAAYPNVTVNMRLYTDYSRIYNDVITNIATDTTPNVCITYPDHIATYLSGSDVILPLDGLLTDERYGLGGSEVAFDAPTAEEIVPAYLEECRIGGVCYALPYMRSTEACYVNKTYVEALGYTLPECLTWDFIWEVSEAAMAKDEEGNFLINGQSVMIPFIYKSTDNMMIQMLRQKGAGYSDGEGNIAIFNDDTRAILEEIAVHGASRAFSTFKISSYPANFLNAGQCIFAIDSTAGSTWMGSKAPLSDISEENIVDFETVVMPIPQFDTEHPQMISQGPSVCVFNKKDPQVVMASWLFVQFLLTNDVQIAYAETEGYVPVTVKAQEDERYREYLSLGGTDDKEHYSVKIDATRLLLANTDATFVTPVFNGSASLREAAGQLIEDTVKQVRRKKTADDAFFEALFSEVTSLYRLDQLSGSGETELGPLPAASKALLIALAAVWVLMGVYMLYQHKNTKSTKNR